MRREIVKGGGRKGGKTRDCFRIGRDLCDNCKIIKIRREGG